MRKILWGMALVTAWGCGDRDVEIARQLMQTDPNGGPPSVLMIADCQSYGFIEMDRACVVDSDGKTYGLSGGDLNVTSAAPPYGVYFLFVDSAVPLPEDISTSGLDASVQVYAAPYNVQGWPCCAEDDPRGSNQSNRIAARASLTQEGGLLVTVHDALPAGYQVAVTLHYGALYRGRVHPADGGACTLPYDLCSMSEQRGWTARFYVDSAPALSTADGNVPQGAGK
jgi:hypothetical protein